MATPNRFQIYTKTAINLVSESNSQPRESGIRISNNIVKKSNFLGFYQRYTHRVLQTIQIELILLCVWADQVVLGSAKTA